MARAGEKQQRDTQTQDDDRNRATQQGSGSQSSMAQQGTGSQARGTQQQQPQRQQAALSQRRQSVPATSANPFSFMRRFGEDMEQLLDAFGFGGLATRDLSRITEWTPRIEMFEREGQLHIRADLPGTDKENVQVELRDDSIILRGERREERREEQGGIYRTEVSYGSFYREIPLPEGVDTNRATATFNNGVLEITMPVAQGETRGRRLEIQDSQSGEQNQQRGQAAGAGR